MKNVLEIVQISIDGVIIETNCISPREALQLLHKHKPFKEARVYALDGWNWSYTTINGIIKRGDK